jgi:hypothetical protein
MSTSTTGGPTEYSLAEISGAISRVTGLAPAEISDLSGQLYSDLRNNPSLRMAGLDSAAVMAYVAMHLTGDVAEKMDPVKREALLREQAKNANSTSAAAQGNLVFVNGQWVSAESSGGARAGGSEARRSYSELPGEWTTAKLQGLAEKLGVGWAANNPELLRLGPAAIQALADVHLKQENYQRLTGEFGLTSKETVETAKYAKKAGVDLNAATEQAAEVRHQLPADQQKTFTDSIRGFMPHIGEQKAQEKFNGEMESIKRKSPATAPQIEKLQKTLKSRAETELKTSNEKQKTNNEAVAKENVRIVAKTQKENTKAKLLASLD